MADASIARNSEDIQPQGDHLRWGRAILVFLLIITSLVLVGALAVLVVTGTDWGRARVRSFALSSINGMIHGKATMGKLSGNLLTGLTINNLAITDSSGAPFVAVQSFTAKYSIMSLIRKHIWIEDAEIVRPLIVLDHPPNGVWNYQRIFPTDTTKKADTTAGGWGSWLRFTNASLVNGQIIVRTPWKPDSTLTATQQDSIVRVALAGGSRNRIQRAPGGYQKILQLDSLSAKLPLIRLAEPGTPNRLIQVSALTMNAYPFQPPGVIVRDLKGSFSVNTDSLWWKGAYVALPQTTATADGSYQLTSGDVAVAVHTDHASFADLRFLYPALPAGDAKADVRLQTHGAQSDILATNTAITMGNARANGSFGAMIGDTIALHDTDLRFSGFDTRTIEQLVPHFKSPRRGVLAGRLQATGGLHAMAVNADITFNDQQAGTSRVTAVGTAGMLEKGGIVAHDLRIQLLPVQVDMARTWMPSLPVGGVLTGSATVNGSTTTQLAVTTNLDHRDRGTHSAISGRAAMRLTGNKWFDVDMRAEPVSLVELGRFAPSAGLQGSATGPIRATGTLADLHVSTDLRLPDGGRFVTRGVVDVASKEKAYDLTSTLYTVNLRTLDEKAPITSLTANAAVHGRGTELATMQATLAADFSTSSYDTLAALDTISVRASVAGGVATIARLYAYGAKTAANVSGTFGLARNHTGQLAYRVDVDSLGAFNRWLPKAKGDTVPVAPRPAVVARATARARADSTRVARATEMERMLNGHPAPRLAVTVPKPVPADTMSGAVHLAGTLNGNLYDFNLRGRAGGQDVVARGNFVHVFQAEYAWNNARTPQATVAVGLDADSISAMGFAFDTLNLRATYNNPTDGGHLELAMTQAENRRYGAKGDYSLHTDLRELKLADMSFRFDTAFWSMPHPTTIQWGGPGIRVTDFELRNRGTGRVYATGLLPTNGTADFRLDVDNFPVSNIVDIVQTDIAMTGDISLHGTMTGAMTAPTFKGTYGLSQATYNGAVVPELAGRFGYADQQLVSHLDATRNGGKPMVVADARVPINLALSGVTGNRLLPEPMAVDVDADSLPLELIPQFTEAVANVHGRAAARLSMRGTLSRPTLLGGIVLGDGSMKLVATGATLTGMWASVRMANDTVYVDSIVGAARGPVRIRGNVAVGNWREPSFNLYFVANSAELLNNDKGRVRIDAGIAVTGRLNSPFVSGAATIVQGVFYAPETAGQHLIGAGDPALFNVVDTTDVNDRALFSPASPMLANLRVQMALSIKHDTWVRNREANIEVYTDDPVNINMEQSALSLTGAVSTDRGEYNILSKRFQVKRGSALFIGTADLNPTLQITGEYQVAVTGHPVTNINVLIGGTLRKPKLTLDSDAQPPRTQSELLSLLAFGQSTTNLLSFNSGSSVAGGGGAGGGSDLVGAGARMAATRLAGVAVGVLVDQLEVQAGRAFGTDVLDITPGDVPLFNGGSAFTNFITQTRVEAGKYINGRTYVSGLEEAGRPGITIEHRTLDGWRFNASFQPRILLREPTLNPNLQAYQKVQTYGGFILREWRF